MTLIPNPLKPTVRKDRAVPSRPWHAVCPCGWEHHSAWHRLAVVIAIHHTHLRKAA